jgi:transposase
MKNRYYNRSRILEAKFREVSLDIDATKTAEVTHLNRNTINKIFDGIRQIICFEGMKTAPSNGVFELDESYFGAKRVRGKRGRGAAGKTPVFGLLKRGGEVYVEVVKNCSREQLIPIIQGKILENSTIHTDGWRAYDGLILNGYDHYRVYHSHNEFARGKCHVNGIESFWSYCKRRLSKFNGMNSEKFILYLKECEFRWNNKDKNLCQILLKLIRKNPLN